MANETETTGGASAPGVATPEIGSSPAAGSSADAWRAALAARRTEVAPETTVPTAVAHAPALELSRRRFNNRDPSLLHPCDVPKQHDFFSLIAPCDGRSLHDLAHLVAKGS